jgi:CheY-like chemotaxis protein
VDDLDRCSPENVFQAFEAMKLYLDAPGFVFVVGYDADVISDAILREKKYGEAVTSRGYIEKIVQIVHRIPPPGDDAAAAFLKACLAESGTTALFDDTARELVTERNARNPRRIKRFLNSFVLGYGLDPAWGEIGAKKLMQVLILQLYFPAFARLLYDRTQDPIEEFFEYVRVREIFQRAGRFEEVKEFVESHGLVGLSADPGGVAELDRGVPEEFPPLARQREFTLLIESFRDPAERQGMLDRVRRSPPPQVADRARPSPEVARPSDSLAELEIAWVDDNPNKYASFEASITSHGAHVVWIRPGAESEALEGRDVDVLISGISRGDDEAAGLEALERLRKDGTYRGPAIFYAGRITGERRDRARRLGAQITNDPDELTHFLATVKRAATVTVRPSDFERDRRAGIHPPPMNS